MFKKIKKKILPQKKAKGEDKKIPQEILDKLPPGMKIKRIEIGPGNLIRWALSLLLMYMAVSTLISFLVGDSVKKVPISELVTAVKEDKVEEVTVMDNEILAKLKNNNQTLVSSKENDISMTEITNDGHK